MIDRVYPFLHLSRGLGLEIICPDRGYQAECILVPFERHWRTGMHIGQLKESKELIFSCTLVIGQMCRPQHEPSFLPCLCEEK